MGLGDVPPEILWAIAGHLPRVSYKAAFCAALALDLGALLEPCGSTTVATVVVLERSAPLSVVRPIVVRRRRAADGVPFAWLLATIRGGRVDVVAWLHDAAGIKTAHDLTKWHDWPSWRPKTTCKRVACAERAMIECVLHGTCPVLAWLLKLYTDVSFCHGARVFDRGVLRRLVAAAIGAERANAPDVVRLLHRPYPRPKHKCRCPGALALEALAAGDAVREAMADVRCCALEHEAKTDPLWTVVRIAPLQVARFVSPGAMWAHLADYDREVDHAAMCGNTYILGVLGALAGKSLERATVTAAAHGQLDAVRWCIDVLAGSRRPWLWGDIAEEARRHGYKHIIDWMIQQEHLRAALSKGPEGLAKWRMP